MEARGSWESVDGEEQSEQWVVIGTEWLLPLDPRCNLTLMSRADQAAADAQVTDLEWEKKVGEQSSWVGWWEGLGVASAGCCVQGRLCRGRCASH